MQTGRSGVGGGITRAMLPASGRASGRVRGSFSYTRPMESRGNADRAVPALLIVGSAVVFIVLVVAGGAFYQSFDEAKYVGLGRNLVAGRGYTTVFGSLFLTHPPAWPVILAAPEAWFGIDPLIVGRFLNVLSGAGLIVLAGLLDRKSTRLNSSHL